MENGEIELQSKMYSWCNVADRYKASIFRLSETKAKLVFPMISNHFQCRKYRFPNVSLRWKCQLFQALNEWNFQQIIELLLYFHTIDEK